MLTSGFVRELSSRARMSGLLVVFFVALVVGQAMASRASQQVAITDKVFTGAVTQDGDVGKVSVHDLSTGEVREIFRPREGRVFDITASPGANLVAVREQVLKYEVAPADATFQLPTAAGPRNAMEKSILRILTQNGVEIDALEQVRGYAWSPDGRRLAYITGQFQGPYANHTKTGAWIWSLDDRRRQRIGDGADYIVWAVFDGNIYLWDPTSGRAESVIRYNVTSGKLELTAHKSIYFSRSGDYYYHPGGGTGQPEDVYVRSTNDGLRETSRILSNTYGWRSLGWAPDADLLLIEVSRKTSAPGMDEVAIIIYNPKEDSSIDIRARELLGWGSTGEYLIVRDGTRIEKKVLSELRVSQKP